SVIAGKFSCRTAKQYTAEQRGNLQHLPQIPKFFGPLSFREGAVLKEKTLLFLKEKKQKNFSGKPDHLSLRGSSAAGLQSSTQLNNVAIFSISLKYQSSLGPFLSGKRRFKQAEASYIIKFSSTYKKF
ncbi:MAG: hypothetical protein Q4B50_08585, partial [Bacillota bacterium]|nr:hypothetical protein [Bacillota bacterium]